MIGAYPGSFDPPTVAHVAIVEAARRLLSLRRVDLVLSRSALGKEHGHAVRLEDRVGVLATMATTRPWLAWKVTDAQLLVDVAAGYDVLIVGADKWAQVIDPAWYGGSVEARDDAVARLPQVLVVPRPPLPAPSGVASLELPSAEVAENAEVSSSAVRAGRYEWMAPEAAAFAEESGAWIDPERYAAWVAASGGGGSEEAAPD